ncbi:MAG: oligosaccharide flippase family protein [Planctomycetes bacterium]|nr:oligosaccharide flippase family protein [Planctomycetota bacterium]
MIRAALHRLSRHTLIYSTAEQLGRLAGFLLLPLTTGYLGEVEFGTRELVAVTITLLAQLAGVNISAAMSRFYFDAHDDNARRAVISTSILSVAAAAIVVGAIALGTAGVWAHLLPFPGEDKTVILRLTIGIFVLQVLREIQSKVLQTQERSILYGTLSLAKLAAEVGLQVLFLVKLRAGLIGLLEAVAITECSFALIHAFILLPSIGVRFSVSVFRRLLAYSLPLVPNGILQFCLHSSDRYFISALCGGGALGLYALGYKLGYVTNYLILGPFLLIWYPFVFSLPSDEVRRSMIGRLTPYFMLVLTAATLATSLFADVLVGSASRGHGFIAATGTVPWVATGYWCWGLFQILQTGFFVSKRTQLLPRLTFSALVTNVFLNISLIPALGFLGAAVATALTFAVLCICTGLKAHVEYAVLHRWGRILTPALAAMLASLVVVAARSLVPPHFHHALGGVALALWTLLAWRVALDRAERAACTATVLTISRKLAGRNSHPTE